MSRFWSLGDGDRYGLCKIACRSLTSSLAYSLFIEIEKGIKMELLMKLLFSTIILIFAIAQTAVAEEHACKREITGRGDSVYCENAAQSHTRCWSVHGRRDVLGEELYSVSCSDNDGPLYNVSSDDLTRDEAQLLLDKIELQIEFGH
jgi:hypothetical protein